MLQELQAGLNLAKVVGRIPIINFDTPHRICPVCGQDLIVSKVKEARKVFSVAYSELRIREWIRECPECGVKYRSDYLPEIVKPGCNYAYDCIVEAGRLRYMDKRQISEIQLIFQNKYHLQVSQTQIRRLCYNFLYYLGRFHYKSADKITHVLKQQGGYILFIDSTCEGKGVHLLTCLDGQSNYVLYSKKIKSENSEDLQKCFELVKKMYGIPLCCVTDMGRGINNALDIVFNGVMRIICHFHLLRDIGKDLFKDLYVILQKTLSKHKIYAAIRYQTQALEKTAGSREKAGQLFFNTIDNDRENTEAKELLIGLMYGYLQSLKRFENSGEGYGFPFDRPKLKYYRQLQKINTELQQIDNDTVFDQALKKKCRFYKIKDVLDQILSDNDLKQTVKKLEQEVICFDKFRDILRIAECGNKAGLNDQGKINTAKQLISTEKKLRKYINTLKKQTDKAPEKYKKRVGVIKQMDKYWDKIFARPIKIVVNGKEKEIIPQRTNNTSEQFYRKIKHLLRRLHGKPTVSKDLDYLPEEIVLIENLKNESYLKNIVGGMDALVKKFAQLDIQNIKLDFNTNELQIKVPQKIIKNLKNFKPLNTIKNFKFALTNNN
ncbi:MAG: hypothetical protein KAI79_05055 [Bacteroidales bacterium]|nr:hypothetical protein [Bacteroidales bacterium]